MYLKYLSVLFPSSPLNSQDGGEGERLGEGVDQSFFNMTSWVESRNQINQMYTVHRHIDIKISQISTNRTLQPLEYGTKPFYILYY